MNAVAEEVQGWCFGKAGAESDDPGAFFAFDGGIFVVASEICLPVLEAD